MSVTRSAGSSVSAGTPVHVNVLEHKWFAGELLRPWFACSPSGVVTARWKYCHCCTWTQVTNNTYLFHLVTAMELATIIY